MYDVRFINNVRFVDETVWLTQAQLCELYQTSKSSVSEHIKNIFEEGELSEESTVRKFRTVQMEGEKNVARSILHYDLDMIISLGYRGAWQRLCTMYNVRCTIAEFARVARGRRASANAR